MRQVVRTILSAFVFSGTIAAVATAQVIGSGGGTNSFPFTVMFPQFPSTVYQQVYAASDFAAGPRLITAIDFFRSSVGGNLNTGTYDFYLSTTSAPVDGLNTTNFDANDGPDNTLFGSFTLGGAAPAILTFTGTPFLYDPANGNLLLDIRTTITASGDNSNYDANRGDAGGVYSRAHDFGTGFTGYGLVTEFDNSPVSSTPEPASLLLVATGFGGMVLIRRLRNRA
jgi:hypothetical protein